MSEELTLWAVFTNSDLTEGRGREFAKHICRVEATAKRLCKGGYVQGGDCPVIAVQLVEIEGEQYLPASVVSIVEPNSDDVRAQADLSAWKAVRDKAQTLGLTSDEIDLLTKGGRR